MPSDLVRLNVNLNKETAAALKEIAERQDISMTEAIRRAVAVLKFVSDEQAKDRKIQTMNQDGSDKRQLVMM